MPLSPGTSRATFSHNVSEMVHAGHPLDQALAASYREKGESRATGGGLGDATVRPMRWRNEMLDIAQPPQDQTRGKPAQGYAEGGPTKPSEGQRPLPLSDQFLDSLARKAAQGQWPPPIKPGWVKANGGGIGLALGGAPAPWQVRAEARSMMHSGPIVSAVPGRTDRHNMSVGSGSYVIPAQAVSHLGQSNTIAGMKVLNGMFGQAGPYGAGGMKIAHGAGAPKPPRIGMRADGGAADDGGARGGDTLEPVDVVTAGGEFVVPPESVAAVGGGDMKHGHNVLDAWVNSILDDHIRTLKKLPGPAKS